MKVLSPSGLHYPITVGELAKKRDDEVQRSEPLFTYFYETIVEEGDKWGEKKNVKKRFPVKFEASADGTITKWFIKEGTVIQRPGLELLEIEEPCTHETQFGGLCVDCGKDMTEVDYLTKELNSERATVNTTHDNVALLVSQQESRRADEETKKRLLSSKKLHLIVDLDQTVIHTTCERTIAEWQADPENPNYEAVKDVRGFQLADDNVANVAANWYYVKMRPGLQEFFDRVSQMYELHIYTMATRAYAQAVAKIIDPERKYFGDRILSRDENYTDKLKSLHRLFPNNTDMVVIIDDRADIWHYSDNLIRVPVFNFFPGAGDINASFLPKQQELVTTPSKSKVAESTAKDKSGAEGEAISAFSVAANPTETVPAESTNGVVSELEQQLIQMGAGESPEVLEQQVKEQEKVIISQQTERPLLQQQLVLDKEDEEAEESESPEAAENGDSQSSEHHRHRHSLLHDDDRGLEVIEDNLRRVHKAFYDEYQKKKIMPHGGRVAELKGEKSPKKRPLDDAIPNVTQLMPRIKRKVLEGCTIVFSGIIPLGMDVENSDFALWVKSFGAEISLNVNRSTTHVIANPDRKTTKVKKAARYPHIKIVNAEWMFQCCTRWERVDETPYTIEVDAAERGGSPFEELEDDSINVTGDEEGEPYESPTNLDMSDDKWQSLGDEFEEFMNESDDTEDASASDSESVRSTASTQSDAKGTKRKRKRKTDSADGSEAEDSDASVNSTSRLQKRKKRTMERVTSLTNVVSADKSSGLPSPETTGPEEGQGEEDDKVFDPQGQGVDLASDYDDGLEAEMMAEFEKSGGEDDA
ncbi:RNA polymerase II subunit A C-terminal domain phosphatase [Trematosphaeria pertusa]|uniref:RNA polymerase II subunit A C-terminal domain phosphatase n=1 Tax=Trematosphaeria pertusa TaxID=390896 RepID=A0A6A6I4V6_9PLEO|nr:RNA polymerase II subunit A C-terminal domain phosphatase [Trematosphaeria pertusa]KAF2244620.1 RNA polymerase II subunit A C-terminal domain phosphatase [Trematosphaeria pertusa]